MTLPRAPQLGSIPSRTMNLKTSPYCLDPRSPSPRRSSDFADVVETKNGARIVGKVAKIDDGTVVVDTDYAGDIDDQAVRSDVDHDRCPGGGAPGDGTRIEGTGFQRRRRCAAGRGRRRPPSTPPSTKSPRRWPAGGKDPEVVALERHWAYEATVDIAGKTGNKSSSAPPAAFRATLKTPQDTLQFYSAYNRQVSEGVKSADQFKAGVDYQNNFAGKTSWYVRDEGGFDRVKDIELYNVAACGLWLRFHQAAEALADGSRRSLVPLRELQEPGDHDVSSAGLGFRPQPRMGVREFEDRQPPLVRAVVRRFLELPHQRTRSFYEIPLDDPAWKLRLGVSQRLQQQARQGRREARHHLLHPLRAELEVIPRSGFIPRNKCVSDGLILA